jgi:putative transposase
MAANGGQTCIIHLIRNTFRFASRADHDALKKDLRAIYTAPTAEAADYDVEIRRVICSTNAIESLNARYRRAVRARGHFPTEQAALKCLYLVTRSLDPTGTGRTRWTMRWKPVIDAFAITFSARRPGAESY